MKKLVATSCVLGVGLALAQANYTYENDGKTYVVNVPAGETEEISAEAAGVLNANAVTNFVKRGDGLLTVSADLDRFTGDLYVEDGDYRMKPQTGTNYAMGATLDAATVYVANGATLSLDTSVEIRKANHTVCFEGEGHEGKGAILAVRVPFTVDRDPIGSKWVLTGDATVNQATGQHFSFSGNAAKLDMRGHTLTYRSGSAANGSCYVRFGYDAELQKNNGDLVVAAGALNLSGSTGWLTCSPKGARTLTVRKNARLILNGASVDIPYGVVFEEGCDILRLNGGGSGCNHLVGPVRIDPPMQRIEGSCYVSFYGMISGGGLLANTNVNLIINNQYAGGYNTFTNGIRALKGATVQLTWGEGVIPQDGGPIELTDAKLWTNNGLTYKLPDLILNGTCEVIGKHDWGYDGGKSDNYKEDCFRDMGTLTFGDNAKVAFSTNVVAYSCRGLGDIRGATTLKDKGGSVGVSARRLKICDRWDIDTAQIAAGQQMLVNDVLDLCGGIAINLRGAARPKGGSQTFVVARAGTAINWLGAKTLTTEDPDHWRLRIGDDGRTLLADYRPSGAFLVVR